jgi:hypothetical protein
MVLESGHWQITEGFQRLSAVAEKQPFFWVLVSISTAQGSQKRHLKMATAVPNPDN